MENHDYTKFFPTGIISLIRYLWRRIPPIDKRFLLQELEDPRRRDAFLHSSIYQYFVVQEMSHWSSYDLSCATEFVSNGSCKKNHFNYKYFLEHPKILDEIHKRAVPGVIDFWQWISDRFKGGNEGLVLGAGSGNHCRMLIDLGIARHVTAYDIAEKLVHQVSIEYKRLGYPINYFTADLNFVHLAPTKYDICLFMYSLHHIIALESLIMQVANALRSISSTLLIMDYVGPRFVELPKSSYKNVFAIYKKIPERFKVTKDKNGIVRQPVYGNRWEIQRFSPFEAVRSDRILDILNIYFQTETFRILGGGLLLPVLNPIIHNFDPDDSEANEVLDWLMAEDINLTLNGDIPNFFAFLMANPRK